MTTCPQCGRELSGLGYYCWACDAYVADMTEGPTPARAADVIKDDRLEAEIQEAGRKALELLGFTVYSLSQDRATRQTPGIPDTYVVGHGRATWAEWKTAKGRQSAAQLAFEGIAIFNGVEYHVWRHENDAIEWARAGT